MALSDYDFDIKYRPGKHNTDADCLSRLPGIEKDVEFQDIGVDSIKAICNSIHAVPIVEILPSSAAIVDSSLYESSGQDISNFSNRN